MTVKQFRKWLLIGLGIVALFVLTQQLGLLLPSNKGAYPMQEDTGHEIRIRVQPKQVQVGKQTVFKLILETYERPDILEINFMDSTLLIDQDDVPYLPVSWHEDTRHEYAVEGLISFPELAPNTTSFKLVLFEYEDHEFEWTVPKQGEKN